MIKYFLILILIFLSVHSVKSQSAFKVIDTVNIGMYQLRVVYVKLQNYDVPTAKTDSVNIPFAKYFPRDTTAKSLIEKPFYLFYLLSNGNIKWGFYLSNKIDDQAKYTVAYVPQKPEDMKTTIPSLVKGNVSEFAAEQIISMNLDSTAKITGSSEEKYFIFRGKTYRIQLYSDIRKEVIKISEDLIKMMDKD
jgi:hypothetical protein